MSQNRTCEVCGRAIHSQARLCPGHKKIADRLEFRKGFGVDKEARIEAMKRSWRPDPGALSCHHTGVLLTTDHGWPHPAYPDLGHLEPPDPKQIAIVASRVNAMMGGLTDQDFRRFVIELARKFQGEAYDAGLLKDLVYRTYATAPSPPGGPL